MSHFALNDHALVVCSDNNLLHVYAISKEWLDEAWNDYASWTANKKMDARSAYIRTQVSADH